MTTRFEFVLMPAERRTLERLAKEDGRSAADFLRRLIHNESLANAERRKTTREAIARVLPDDPYI